MLELRAGHTVPSRVSTPSVFDFQLELRVFSLDSTLNEIRPCFDTTRSHQDSNSNPADYIRPTFVGLITKEQISRDRCSERPPARPSRQSGYYSLRTICRHAFLIDESGQPELDSPDRSLRLIKKVPEMVCNSAATLPE